MPFVLRVFRSPGDPEYSETSAVPEYSASSRIPEYSVTSVVPEYCVQMAPENFSIALSVAVALKRDDEPGS